MKSTKRSSLSSSKPISSYGPRFPGGDGIRPTPASGSRFQWRTGLVSRFGFTCTSRFESLGSTRSSWFGGTAPYAVLMFVVPTSTNATDPARGGGGRPTSISGETPIATAGPTHRRIFRTPLVRTSGRTSIARFLRDFARNARSGSRRPGSTQISTARSRIRFEVAHDFL